MAGVRPISKTFQKQSCNHGDVPFKDLSVWEFELVLSRGPQLGFLTWFFRSRALCSKHGSKTERRKQAERARIGEWAYPGVLGV